MPTPQAASLSTPSAAGAWQLLRLHRPELALAMAEQLLATDPAALSAHQARTEALRQLGRLPEAAEAARHTIGQAPQVAAAFFALAQVLGQQGHLKPAEANAREALRLDPLDAAAHGFLAQLLYLQGYPKRAIASADAGLRCQPRHLDCLLWRALAQEQTDQPEQADADFHQLLYLAPNSALAHSRRGKQLLWRYEPAAAAIHLAEALRLTPAKSLELVPLLRRARREQHWPGWLRRRVWQQRQERWSLGIGASLAGYFVRLALPWYRLRSWWLTRRDPLFKERLPRQPSPKLWYWLTWVSVCLVVGLFCLMVGAPPFLAAFPAYFLARRAARRASRPR